MPLSIHVFPSQGLLTVNFTRLIILYLQTEHKDVAEMPAAWHSLKATCLGGNQHLWCST